MSEAAKSLLHCAELARSQLETARDQFVADAAFNVWLAENKLGRPDRLSALLAIDEHPDNIMAFIEEMLFDAYQRVTGINKNTESAREATAPEPVVDSRPLAPGYPAMPKFLDRTGGAAS
jgi:hypothetical protein